MTVVDGTSVLKLMPLPSGGAVTALAVTERALIRPLRGHLPQRGRLLCLTNALKAAIMNRLTGCGEAWYRAWFGSKRPRVRIPTLRPQKASAAAGAFFIPSTLRLRMRLHAYTLYTRIFGSVPNENDSLRQAAGRRAASQCVTNAGRSSYILWAPRPAASRR